MKLCLNVGCTKRGFLSIWNCFSFLFVCVCVYIYIINEEIH